MRRITIGVVGFYFNTLGRRKSVFILSFLAIDVGLALCLLFSVKCRYCYMVIMTVTFLVVSILLQALSPNSLRLHLCCILLFSMSVLLLIYSCINLVSLLFVQMRRLRSVVPLFSINLTRSIIAEVQSIAVLSGFASQLLIITLVRCCGLHLPFWLCIAPSCCLLCVFLLAHYAIQGVFLLHVLVPFHLQGRDGASAPIFSPFT